MSDLLGRVRDVLADQYEVTSEVGRGGMAVVFVANDLKHHRRVAIKVLLPELAAAVGPDRFLREIEVASRLQHPHIVPLFDSGSAGGLLYFVMPFVDGETLGERLEREGALPPDEAIQIARQVATALASAHRAGIVHRDIKPGNIMLSGGAAVVTDFGIARAVGDAAAEKLTATGIAIGSPRYMSPEQAGGEAPDERGDIYSLACVLYEMLSGESPFQGETFMSLLGKHATEPVPDLKGTRSPVPYAAERALYRALEKRPEDRFPDADAFILALTHAPGWRGRVADTWTDLWRRRVPQTLIVYGACTWIVVMTVRLLVDRLVLSPYLPGFAFTALLALLPSAAIVSYYHGGTGHAWPAAEKVGVTLNALGALTLLFLLYWGKDLGRATHTVMVTDEAGQTMARVVPKSEFRRRVGIFYFSGVPARDGGWLSYGLPLALDADLAQDLMVDVQVGFEEELRREGVADPTRVPRALAIRVAADAGYTYALIGELTDTEGGRRLSTTLLDTRRGRAGRSLTWEVDERDVLSLVDSLSVTLRRDLEIPSAYMKEVPDLPASDMLTSDSEALRSWARGTLLRRAGGDPDGATALLEDAVARDSTFALAWNELALSALAAGRTDDAVSAKEAALKSDWRLPEARRLAVLQGYYLITGALDRAARLAETRVILLPDDLGARADLASLYAIRRKPDEAAAEYRVLHSLEPGRGEYLQLEADAYRRAGRMEDAAAAYRSYREAAGDGPEVLGEIGRFYREVGELDSALAYLESAVLLDPRSPPLLRELAGVRLDLGEREPALEALREALAAADSPDEEFEVRQSLAEHFKSLGRLAEARAQADSAYALAASFQHEIQRNITRLEMLDLVALTDGAAAALAEVPGISDRLPGPFRGLATYGPFRVYLAMEDPARLEEATRAFRSGVSNTPFGDMFGQAIVASEGYTLLWRGNCAEAAGRLEEAILMSPGSIEPQLGLARARLCAGDLAAADSALQGAARLSPANPHLLVIRAEVLAARGDQPGALAALDAALALWAEADEGYGPRETAARIRRRIAGPG
jgi:tetratricopeptide (TPR) repeat protein